jgi:hypothetical protein
MRSKSFRYCMLIGALALLGVAIYYFANYVTLAIALNNNNLQPSLNQSIRALWLAFACQNLLVGLLYVLVAYKPHTVSREVIVLLGLMQLVESMLLFVFSGSRIVAYLLIAASVFVMIGASMWPKKLPAAGAGPATPEPAAPARTPGEDWS